jgi:hypothetical protein
MTNNQDLLNQLWQQQSVERADVSLINKQWKLLRMKQRLYVAVDVMSVLIPFIFILLYADKLDKFTFIFALFVMALSLPFIIYITWLRRFSLGWSSVDTEEHIQKLNKQITNNIKIAYVTKHSVWPTILVPIVHFSGLYYLDVFTVEKLIYKSQFSIGILVIMLPCIWIWANKRQKRFSKDLVHLNNLLDKNSQI